jgi:uncharacterized protein YjbI with pentapeptide repeats
MPVRVQVVECGPKLVASLEHLDLLRQGVEVWNAWRAEKPSIRPDLIDANLSGANLSAAYLSGAYLSGAKLNGANLSAANLFWADLSEADLTGVKLSEAKLSEANLCRADLIGANLSEADLIEANLREANLTGANLAEADLTQANLSNANLSGADLSEADLSDANLFGANLSEANLAGARLIGASLNGANLVGANLVGARLSAANLNGANLNGADLSGANLEGAVLLETNLIDATLTDCRIYGISAWNVKFSKDTKQQDLVITHPFEPAVTVDNLEVAQFVYLLLHNEKIREVIDTIGRKGVLLLGRFTEGRIAVLERLRDELRKRGYLPIVFNFDKPETKDFTETVRLLAGLSKFVIADLTSPKSAPYELGAVVSQTMIPFQPIIAEDETPFSMLQDLWINYPDRVFRPIHYSSPDALIASLDEKIIRPAEARFVELVRRKADTMGGEHV